jgi:hypothetical protein
LIAKRNGVLYKSAELSGQWPSLRLTGFSGGRHDNEKSPWPGDVVTCAFTTGSLAQQPDPQTPFEMNELQKMRSVFEKMKRQKAQERKSISEGIVDENWPGQKM